MKGELKKQINEILDESFFVDDAVGTMRGISAMIQEFMNGNTWLSNDTAENYFMNRLSDILFFAYRSLELTADRTHDQYIEFEKKILNAVSREDASMKGGE